MRRSEYNDTIGINHEVLTMRRSEYNDTIGINHETK